jgi:hypothetical protein
MTAFKPLNDLEVALDAARGGRLPVQKLLHTLANSDVVVPSGAEVHADWSGFEPLLFPKEDVQMLACFTDPSRLGEFTKMAPYCLVMKGRELFKRMPRGYGLVVNPGNTVGFEMSPEGIAQILKELV